MKNTEIKKKQQKWSRRDKMRQESKGKEGQKNKQIQGRRGKRTEQEDERRKIDGREKCYCGDRRKKR